MVHIQLYVTPIWQSNCRSKMNNTNSLAHELKFVFQRILSQQLLNHSKLPNCVKSLITSIEEHCWIRKALISRRGTATAVRRDKSDPLTWCRRPSQPQMPAQPISHCPCDGTPRIGASYRHCTLQSFRRAGFGSCPRAEVIAAELELVVLYSARFLRWIIQGKIKGSYSKKISQLKSEMVSFSKQLKRHSFDKTKTHI